MANTSQSAEMGGERTLSRQGLRNLNLTQLGRSRSLEEMLLPPRRRLPR
jgi:hypothetical protein